MTKPHERYLLNYLLFQIWIQLTSGSVYSFCSERKSFSFSTDACPGGILLKQPLKIDEPCHCFESDVVIYSQCGTGRQIKMQSTQAGCKMSPISISDKWGGQAMLMIPTDFNSSKQEENESSEVMEPCLEIPKQCVKSIERTVILKPVGLQKHLAVIRKETGTTPTFTEESTEREAEDETSNSNSDDSNGGSSYSEEESTTADPTESNEFVDMTNSKSNLNNSIVTQNDMGSKTEVLRGGQKVPEVINGNLIYNPESSEVVFVYNSSSGSKPPTSGDKINRKLRNDEPMMEALLQENEAALRYITNVKAGGITNPLPNTKTFRIIKQSVEIASKVIPNNLIKDVHLEEAYLAFSYFFNKIDEDMKTDKNLNNEDYNSIMLALDNCKDNIYELAFKTSGRPRQAKQFYLLKETGYELTAPLIPDDRIHKIDNEDYIVGTLWKVIDVTYAACFKEFKYSSPSAQFDYFTTIENVFQRPEVQNRWYQPQIVNRKSTANLELISHPNIKIFMENLDKIDAAIHIVSEFKNFLKKPKGLFKSHSRKRSLSMSQSLGDAKTAQIKNIATLGRTKRQTITEYDQSIFEIWGGEAYCLQKIDPNLPAGMHNSVPSIETLCTGLY